MTRVDAVTGSQGERAYDVTTFRSVLRKLKGHGVGDPVRNLYVWKGPLGFLLNRREKVPTVVPTLAG
jgi:hypothetical protein